MKSNLVVRITAQDVGRRVSIRMQIATPDAGPSFTDTVGRLLSWEDDVLRVERRDGAVVALPVSRIVAGKTIPEPLPRRNRLR